jgi:hypothetical protein
MGTRDARDRLTAALMVLGYQAVTYPPPVPTPGQAWPQWVMTEISGGCGFTHTWEVYAVVGGADPQSSATTADAAIEPLADGLAAVAVVVMVEPVMLTMTDNSNGLPCLRARVQTT